MTQLIHKMQLPSDPNMAHVYTVQCVDFEMLSCDISQQGAAFAWYKCNPVDTPDYVSYEIICRYTGYEYTEDYGWKFLGTLQRDGTVNHYFWRKIT